MIPQSRATCPMCHEAMIYTCLLARDTVMWAWLCNCRTQPDHVLADIENARLEPLTELAYDLADPA